MSDFSMPPIPAPNSPAEDYGTNDDTRLHDGRILWEYLIRQSRNGRSAGLHDGSSTKRRVNERARTLQKKSRLAVEAGSANSPSDFVAAFH